MHPSQISDWESLTQLVSSASPAQTGGQITRSLLEDFGLKHEIDETREAERYKFGDGGTLVSSIRVTAPMFVAGKKGRIVFSVVPSKHLALVDWPRFPDSCQSCCGYVTRRRSGLELASMIWS